MEKGYMPIKKNFITNEKIISKAGDDFFYALQRGKCFPTDGVIIIAGQKICCNINDFEFLILARNRESVSFPEFLAKSILLFVD